MEKLTIITKHRKESEMKQLMKKVIFIVLCMMTISSLNAETIVTVDGINYSLSGAYASVRGLAQEMTDVSVHEKIEYQGLTYIVNRIGTNAFAYYDEFRKDGKTKCHVKAQYLATYKKKFSDFNLIFVGDLK